MKFMLKSLFVAALAVVFAACAATVEHPLTLEQKLEQKRYAVGERVDRIQDYRLTGWNSVDDEHLIIHTGPSDSYLLTLKTRCHNLRSAEDIGLSTTVGSLTRLDKVIVRSRPDGYVEHCLIEDINALERLPSQS